VHPTVYVSATSLDLPRHREAVRQAIRRADCAPVESYSADTRAPLEKCLDDVENSDIYVGIFAYRYGHIPPGESLSITELEYRKAIELGKPCLIFVLHEDALWAPRLVDKGEAAVKLAALHDDLTRKHVVYYFKDVDDLAKAVTDALMTYRTIDAPGPTGAGMSPVAQPSEWAPYFRRLAERYLGVEMQALMLRPRTATLRIPLTSLFLEPNTHEDADAESPNGWNYPASEGEQELSIAATPTTPPSTPLFDTLTNPKYDRVVLLGDPGAGKSAVARYLALALTDQHDDPRLAQLSGYLPLMVELRSYVAGPRATEDTFIDYLDFRKRKDGLGIGRDDLLAYLDRGGPVLMLFDGLDEIFDRGVREDVAEQIALFAARYSNVRTLVTSRTIGYRHHLLAGFHHVTLEDMDSAGISEFLRRWYEQVMPDAPQEAEHLRARMLTAIHVSPAIRELAGNPLLLSILAVVGKDENLPQGRWSVYQHAADVLVDYWDADRNMSGIGGGPGLTTDDKRKLLRRLAFRMQSQREGLNPNYIARDQLVDLFEEYLVDQRAYDRPTARGLADAMIQQFHERNFILRLYGHEIYGFVHRTFLEFFYVQAIERRLRSDDPEWTVDRLKDLVRDHWADTSWREVFLLLIGKVDVTIASQLIDVLTMEVNRPWRTGAFTEPPWNLMLAVNALAEIGRLDDVAPAAENVLRQVILFIEHGAAVEDRGIMARTESEMLAGARVIGADWPGQDHYLIWYRRRGAAISQLSGSSFATRLAVLLATPQDQIEDFIEQLDAAGRPARLTVMAGLTETVRYAARESGNRRDRCRELLSRHAVHELDGAVRLAALRGLTANFPIDAPLVELLQGRLNATVERYAPVRLAAVDVLGNTRTADAIAYLMGTAATDPNAAVRTAAVRVLGRHSDRPDVTRILVERVRTDSSPRVVEAAARGLRTSSDGDDLRRLLADRLAAEAPPLVKREAVRLLSELFADGETSNLLTGLLDNDEDLGTRVTALRGLDELSFADDDLRTLLAHHARGGPDPHLCLAAQQVLTRRFPGDPVVRDLLALQLSGSPGVAATDPAVRQAAVIALAVQYRTPQTAEILRATATNDIAASVRLTAARQLADRFGADPETRHVLYISVHHEVDPVVRQVIVRLLIAIRSDPRVRHELIACLRRDMDPQIVREAARAFDRFPADRSKISEILIRRLDGETYEPVRLAAIDILRATTADDPALQSVLYKIVQSDDTPPMLLRTAALTLADAKGWSDGLIAILDDRMRNGRVPVQVVAVELLGHAASADLAVRDRLMVVARSGIEAVRRAAVGVLGPLAISENVRDLLIDLLDDDDWSVRRAALAALVDGGFTPEALWPRLQAMADQDGDEQFRLEATRALTCRPHADPEDLPTITHTAVTSSSEPLPPIESRPSRVRTTRAWYGGDTDVLRLGVATSVFFAIEQHEPAGDRSLPPPSERSPDDAGEGDVRVLIIAGSGSVTPHMHTTRLRWDVPSAPLNFVVTPHRVGRLSLRFLVFAADDGVLLQELHADLPVTDLAAERKGGA
jgi:HEAT repeat protein